MVAREGDSYSLVESSVVHLPLVGLARTCYYRKHTLPVLYLVISPELNNRRQSLPKLELEVLSSLYTPILWPWLWSWVKLRFSYSHLSSFGFDIKTGLFSVKCYNDIISMRLRTILCAQIYTNSGCRHLDGLEQWGSSSGGRCFSLAPIMVIVRGSWALPDGEPKEYSSGLFVAYMILILVGCVAPYCGFGVWCQLACEPPSEWITTMRTSLPASKWTSVKNLMSPCLRISLVVLKLIGSILWLAHTLTHQYNHRHSILYYIPSV
jgi:hypothetical protein